MAIGSILWEIAWRRVRRKFEGRMLPWVKLVRWHDWGRLLTNRESPLLPAPEALEMGSCGLCHPLLRQITQQTPLTPWSVDVDVLNTLMAWLHKRGAKRVLEFGSGVSSAALALTCGSLGAPNPQVISIEQDAKHAEGTRQLLVKAGLDDAVHVIVSPLRTQYLGATSCHAYDLSVLRSDALGGWKADSLFVDGPSTGGLSRAAAVIDGLKWAVPDAWILMDDCLRHAEILDMQFLDRCGFVTCCGVFPVGKGLGICTPRK